MNARHGTEHPHEFPKLDAVAEIAAYYPTARSRHDYLCAKTRFMLTDDVPTLFLFSRTLGHSQMTELRDMIGSLRAGRFHILAAGDESTGWMGQDRLWDDALAPFEFYHAAEATIAEPVRSVADLIASQMRRLRRHIKALQF